MDGCIQTPAVTAPIEIGDVITTNISSETDVITIKWSQAQKIRTTEYYYGEYKTQTKEGQSGAIFVQRNRLDQFNKLLKDGKVTVNELFQYGQKDKNSTVRWLVFHARDIRPYQYRYIDAVYEEYGEAAVEVLQRLGLLPGEDVGTWIKDAKKSFAKNLHDFQ